MAQAEAERRLERKSMRENQIVMVATALFSIPLLFWSTTAFRLGIFGVGALVYYGYPRVIRGSARATLSSRRERYRTQLGQDVQIGQRDPDSKYIQKDNDEALARYAGVDPDALSLPELLRWLGAKTIS